MVQFTCIYSDPKDFSGITPVSDVNWNYSSSTCTYNNEIYSPSTSIASSTDIQLYGSFTAGEVLIALMLFILIFMYLMQMLAQSLDKIKTKKKFLGYSGGDVEVKDEL